MLIVWGVTDAIPLRHESCIIELHAAVVSLVGFARAIGAMRIHWQATGDRRMTGSTRQNGAGNSTMTGQFETGATGHETH